jgi:WD40-like Beta Propeller Repeat
MRQMSGVIGGVVLALGLWFVPSALATFPGADGLLAVQPASGRGIVLVGANGRGAHRICTARARCGTPGRPRWSPDGRSLVFAGPAIKIVYTDGSCLDCQFGAAPNPAFEASGTVISFIKRSGVKVDGIDTLRKHAPGILGASDAVWSADREVAVVRNGALWAGRPGKLHRIAVGTEPSWSPHGDRIAAVQHGWVVIVRVRDHRVQRLARGRAPAFSPDGRWIAFVAPNHRLMVMSARGGRPRRVGRIRAASVDWQPRPRGHTRGCVPPPGYEAIASTPAAVVTRYGPAAPPIGATRFPPLAYMGCLRADGRERLLEHFSHNSPDGAAWIGSVPLAPPYAALIKDTDDEHYGGSTTTVQVFDLRTGQQRKDLGGESALCAGPICTRLAEVVLGRDGVSAARTWGVAPLGSLSTPFHTDACAPGSTVCLAEDDAGVLFTSNDSAAGAGSWSPGGITSPPVALWSVTCPARSLCVGADGDVYTSSDPAGGASTWQTTKLNGASSSGGDINCPTTTLCVLTRVDGTIATSTNPTGGTAAWTVSQIDSLHPLTGIVCSAEPRCFMTDSAGTVFTSGNPTGGPGAWTKSSATPAFTSGTCPTSSLCVTVGTAGIATTVAPDSAVWRRQPIPDDLVSVSCPSSSLCVAVGAQGALYVSIDPASGMWSHATIDYGLSLTSVSCASVSLCVATDANGHVVSSTAPDGGPSAWTPTLLEGDPCTDGHSCSIESIEVFNATVDSSRLPGSGPFLTGLTLNGDTLSWSHDGSPRSEQLTPP